MWAHWKGKTGTEEKINVTETLSHAPNYDHIHLTNEELAQAMENVISKSQYIKMASSTDPKIFSEREKDFKFNGDDILLAEKIAINIYTSNEYRKLNNFLNCLGKNEKKIIDLFGSYKKYLDSIPATIALIVVASHGLAKMPSPEKMLFREEKILTTKDKIEAAKKRAVLSLSTFLSTSDMDAESSFYKSDALLFFLIIAESGKDVSVYSVDPKEAEILLPPGTPLEYVAHHEDAEGKQYIGAREKMGVISETDISPITEVKARSLGESTITLFGKSLPQPSLVEMLDKTFLDEALKLKALTGKELLDN